jgi:hypothetical protein
LNSSINYFIKALRESALNASGYTPDKRQSSKHIEKIAAYRAPEYENSKASFLSNFVLNGKAHQASSLNRY